MKSRLCELQNIASNWKMSGFGNLNSCTTNGVICSGSKAIKVHHIKIGKEQEIQTTYKEIWLRRAVFRKFGNTREETEV